ncbi:MAG: carboxypeptidase-like regulatory domain-containing protein [Bacteroidales bacterium]|nr:carboxypeptidase-like regulatory domain-containing protein [Bacteroidales bacterium]
MKSLKLFIILLLFAGRGIAAKLEVSVFRLNEDDPTALHQKRFNDKRQVCALVKLKMSVANLKVKADPAITASIAQPDGSYFLYVSPTTIDFTFEAPGFERLKYQTPSFLQSARVYEMEVVVGDSSESKGSIYIRCNPAAEIFLDDVSQGMSPRFLTGLTTGEYKVRLSAADHKDYVNNKVVVEADKTTDLVITLTSLTAKPADMQTSSRLARQSTKPVKVKKERDPQDNGWFAGFSFGAVFPNNYPANYYNGSPQNRNSFNRIFETYPGYTTSAYNDIKEAIGSYDFDTTNIGFSENMAYNAAANFGLYTGFTFLKMNRIYISFDYHHLKTNGALIFYYIQETPGNKDNYYDKSSVHGTENRFHINLLYSREFRAGEYTNWYLFGGFNLNNIVVKENYVNIPVLGDSQRPPLKYNIKYVYYDKTGAAYTDYVEGGVGFGATAGIGLRLLFSNRFSIDPELQFFYSSAHLEGYEEYKPSLQLNLRINLFTGWIGKGHREE